MIVAWWRKTMRFAVTMNVRFAPIADIIGLDI